MTERECYTTKSIELHLFFGRILLRQIYELSSTADYNVLSVFEEKYKVLLSKTADIGNCLLNGTISLDDSQEIKYINQDILLLLQKFTCILENLSLSVLKWETHFYWQCILCLETQSSYVLPRHWIKQIYKSDFF